MSAPFEQAFQAGAQAGTNLSKGIGRGFEMSGIDQILSQVSQSQDPQEINNAIGAILQNVSPENREGAIQVLQGKMGRFQQQQQGQSFEQMGLDPAIAQFEPATQRELIKRSDKGKETGHADLLRNAFTGIENLVKEGSTGLTPKSLLTPKGREARAELNNLGEIFISNIIPLLNPRGTIPQSRFNYIRDLIPKGTDTDATIKGKLKGLKVIFNDALKQSGISDATKSQDVTDAQIDEALKQTGGDVEKAMQLIGG